MERWIVGDILWGVYIMVLLGGAILGVKQLERHAKASPELCRKLIHIIMGLLMLLFPWVFHSRVTVIVLGAVAFAALLGLRILSARRQAGLGTVLYSVNRRSSLGELIFPVSIVVMFCTSAGDKVVYSIPILILAFADSLAALIGVRYGQNVLSSIKEDSKSLEGLVVFFVAAFLCTQIPLMLFTQVEPVRILLIAVIVGILAAVVEVSASYGLDNLLVPLLSFIFLRVHLSLTLRQLLLNTLWMVGIILVGFLYNRRGYLSRIGVLVGFLAAYVITLIGGISWFPGPLLLFLGYCVCPPIAREERDKVIHSHVVEANVAVPVLLVCWGAIAGTKQELFYPFYTAFAIHLAFNTYIRLNCYYRHSPGYNRGVTYLKSLVMLGVGYGLYRLVTGVWVHPLAVVCSLVVLALAVVVIERLSRLFNYKYIQARNYWMLSLIALSCSLFVVGAVYLGKLL